MSAQEYLSKMNEIQKELLEFIDNDDNIEDSFPKFTIFLQNHNIQDQYYLIEFLHLISNISANHSRKHNLILKIEKILTFLKEEIMQHLTNSRIFNIFKESKRILLFLFEEQFLTINEYIYSKLRTSRDLVKYFEPELVSYLTKKPKKIDTSFAENRREGENQDYLCKLIRTDSVKEFIIYINRSNLSLANIEIEPSLFETNAQLISKKLSLIEYSAFFGSIQIFRYLLQNNVEIKDYLWYFVISSNNPELIHILEESIEITKNINYYYHSISCYHNEIAQYIKDKLLIKIEDETDLLKYHNYDFLPNNIISDKSMFSDLCRHDYFKLVSFMINDLRADELNQILFYFFNIIRLKILNKINS